ncbi:hypothetical protein [Parafrankia colletiae]|uniref:hypothetical protein n=1 Tax=Parafrankia colletiae TaxID=573497 RepID=UPI0018E37420|nr:hypothetical protein [Parafrankia colletiae]
MPEVLIDDPSAMRSSGHQLTSPVPAAPPGPRDWGRDDDELPPRRRATIIMAPASGTPVSAIARPAAAARRPSVT